MEVWLDKGKRLKNWTYIYVSFAALIAVGNGDSIWNDMHFTHYYTQYLKCNSCQDTCNYSLHQDDSTAHKSSNINIKGQVLF